MVTDNFYLVLLIVVTLGFLKFSVGRSSTFLTVISLLCCFCVFETFLTLLPVDQECVLFSSNQFGFKAAASSLSNNHTSVCFSPAEQSFHYCIEQTKYWANLGGCTGALIVII